MFEERTQQRLLKSAFSQRFASHKTMMELAKSGTSDPEDDDADDGFEDSGKV